MQKVRTPVRPRRTVAVPLPGHPDKPAVLVTRRIRALPSGEAPKADSEPSEARVEAPEPAPRRKGLPMGRPRILEDPTKVLLTLEICDLEALDRWKQRRKYPCRSAAMRALIAEVCHHE